MEGMMKVFSATTEINATPDTIWKILTDAPAYPEWDPGMVRLEGKVAPGEKITAYTKVSPDRAFPVMVTTFEPGKRMVWEGGMPLGLFKGVRTFTLESLSGGKTRFTLREEFSGLLLPLIGRTLPDLNKTFEAFNAGLKKRAERQ
jgi:hypothetical protein